MTKQIVVNIADLKMSSKTDEVLITYSLGSCVALAVYDPYKKIGGLIHIMLPESHIERNITNVNPYKFVDLGVPALYKELFKMGGSRNHIITKVIGGSNVMDKNKHFNIGERNYTAVRKILWRNNMIIHKEDVGGSKSRTVRIFIETGKVLVSNSYEEYEL
ncbi:MAG: chemotaxis protein CheD [Candidatus Cloacimonetes bacterium]|nr:chemotaxis protein CheD [Candidatus Cloacimonadota bacterium]